MRTLLELAQALETQRLAQQVTFEELAQASGLSRLATRRVLRAESAPRVTTLMAIADKLGLELVLLPKPVAAGLAPTPTAPRPLSRVEQLKYRTDAAFASPALASEAGAAYAEQPPLQRGRVSRRRKDRP